MQQWPTSMTLHGAISHKVITFYLLFSKGVKLFNAVLQSFVVNGWSQREVCNICIMLFPTICDIHPFVTSCLIGLTKERHVSSFTVIPTKVKNNLLHTMLKNQNQYILKPRDNCLQWTVCTTPTTVINTILSVVMISVCPLHYWHLSTIHCNENGH
jgi:hypothetical protein